MDSDLDLSGAYSHRYDVMMAEYRAYQARHGIQLGSADEEMRNPHTLPEHRAWCAGFSRRWEEMERSLNTARSCIARLWGTP